jgi:hypothetical protein
LSSKYAFVGKDVDVFEHDKLSKFTKIKLQDFVSTVMILVVDSLE